jgi:PiT family inorganic phosphate transporter
MAQMAETVRAATPLVAKYGDDQKQTTIDAANRLTPAMASAGGGQPPEAIPSAVRNVVYRLSSELRLVTKSPHASADEKAEAGRLRGSLKPSVEYAPWWVRILSAVCLGLGTMIGYRRIVHTLGERLGSTHLTPGQGASAELVGAVLIGSAGFTGLPVSTTHIITSGIAGTMIGAGSGVNRGMVMRIALAWVVTLPVTILVAAGLFYLMAS